MDLYNAKLITPAKLFRAYGVSEKTGASELEKLESDGTISPFTTFTGRKVLTIREAEVIVTVLEQRRAGA